MKFKSDIEIQAGVNASGSTGDSGQILSSTGSGVAWIDQSAITSASDFVFFNVKNETGSTILKGKGVMAVGTDGNSGHILIDEMVADGTVESKYFLGVLEEDIANGGFARVISFGQLDQFNTNGQNGETWADGQVLWCDPANPGDFTITEPDGPNVKIAAAFILNSSTNGKIQVRVQANEGVHDLHDTKITSQVDGDVLAWNNTLGVWENSDSLTVETSARIAGDTNLQNQIDTIPSPNNATITIAAGTNMSGGGDFTTDQSTNETITINHANTSGLNGTYGSTSDGTKIDQITVDADGHVTAITTGATGDITGVTAGQGLTGGGTSGSVTLDVQLFATTTTEGILASAVPPVGTDVAYGLDFNYLDSRYYQSGSGLVGSNSDNNIQFYLVPPVGTDIAFDLKPRLNVAAIDFDFSKGQEAGLDDLTFTSPLTGAYHFDGIGSSVRIETIVGPLIGITDEGPMADSYINFKSSSSWTPVPFNNVMEFKCTSSGVYTFSTFNGGTGNGSESNLSIDTNSSFIKTDGYQIGLGPTGNNPSAIQIILSTNVNGPGTIIGDGNMFVTDNFDVFGTKNFRMDHPVSPKTHDLVHTVIESNRGDVFYRGKTKLVDGLATINLDDELGMMAGTFEALTKDVQVFTNNEDGWTATRGKVNGKNLIIEAQDSGCTDEISWMVMGERNDADYVNSERTDENGHLIVEIEETKTKQERVNEIRESINKEEDDKIKTLINTNQI